MAEPPEKIMEEREDLMVSPTGGIPSLRRAHFLKPTFSSSSESPPFRPSGSLSPKPKWPLKVTFNGWRNPSNIWVQWVHRLVSTHQATWRKAGIYDAIMCSTLKICRNDELVMGIVERWSSETNTFVFPWGEATVTLEDMMVLAGYPVLGDSFYFQNNDEGMSKARKKLVEVHLDLSRSRSQKAYHSLWMKHFMEHDRDVEHEAFLSLWLSQFVFPAFPPCVVSKRFFRFAICLARGVQIALAPIVLASIYRDLTLLKASMDASMNLEEAEIDGGNTVYAATLWAPLHLVQVWVWERFVEFRPNPGRLRSGQPRLARWHLIDKHELGNVRPILQSAGDTFQWRPYAIMVDNLPLPAFYREKEELVLVSTNLDMEIEAFARCLRVSELGGIDCVEMYSPHRVAMQFGLDQDIPDHVRKFDVTLEYAWLNYTRPIKDEALFIPSRHVEADVTIRYLKWQRESVMASQAAYDCVLRKRRCSKRVKRSVCTKRKPEDAVYQLDGPPGYHKKDKMLVTGDLGKNDENCLKKEEDVAYELDTPPGFHNKYNRLARENRGKHYENHHPKMSERAHRIDNEYRKGEENCEIGSQAQSPVSSTVDNETNLWADIILPSGEIELKSEAVMRIEYAGIVGNNAGSSVDGSILQSLVTRVSRLEKAIAQLKEAK